MVIDETHISSFQIRFVLIDFDLDLVCTEPTHDEVVRNT